MCGVDKCPYEPPYFPTVHHRNDCADCLIRLFWLDVLQRSRRDQTSSQERLAANKGSVR